MQKTAPTIYCQTYQTPAGPVTIEASETAITGIRIGSAFPPERDRSPESEKNLQLNRGLNRNLNLNLNQNQNRIQIQETDLIRRACEELMEYFSGKRRTFDLPLHAEGTAFQMQVWKELREIPYGETRTYREIAIKTGRPKACRAVGGACHRNPILIMIPCHRVIGTNGSLTGFGGGLPVKEQLLSLERDNQRQVSGRGTASVETVPIPLSL